ncbi:MAG TPA: DUF5671 domain-containing protein [Candidatus Paceibacterota bacterium]|nr:DUF5671 domain-containing protein [Candidatus Paceibacterota bacterium]
MTSKTTPKDFFLWLGVIVATYGSVIALITLLFEYINYVFPDALAYYGDPYSGAIRFSMSALIVLTPIALGLAYLIRRTIKEEPGKADIWVRRWAIVLTLFISAVTIAIDLITLINTFLGGEITTRFTLKVLVILAVAGWVFFHFFLELKNYWVQHQKRSYIVTGLVATAVIAAIVSGFFIIGTPSEVRLVRYDVQKVSDLQTLQYQIVNYYQQKEALPETIEELTDPLSGFTAPVDPQTNEPYRYTKTGNLSFSLCATFNQESKDLEGRGPSMGRDLAYPSVGMGIDENWKHGAGETCFERTIDPERYPAFPKPL